MKAEDRSVGVEDKRRLPIFIHSELDDLGLDPYAFRIYGRLARRAGTPRGAFESIEEMARCCRMSPRRVRQALRDLEAMKLIHREERRGATSIYHLTEKEHWKTPAPDAAPTPAPDAALPRQEVPPTPARGAAEGKQVKGGNSKGPTTPPLSSANEEALTELFGGRSGKQAITELSRKNKNGAVLLEKVAAAARWKFAQKAEAAELLIDHPAAAAAALADTFDRLESLQFPHLFFKKRFQKAINPTTPEPVKSNGEPEKWFIGNGRWGTFEEYLDFIGGKANE